MLFLEAFLKMGINPKNLMPCSNGVVRFTGRETPIDKLITVPLCIEEWSKVSMKMIDFLVVNVRIIGRPSRAAMVIISSFKHQLIKFPTPKVTEQVRSD